MAIWQFVLNLIPSSTATVNGVVAAHMDQDQLDAIELNFCPSISDAFIKRIGAMLPEKPSWTSDLRLWGDDETDDIQIWFHGPAIQYAQFRVNLGNLSLPLVGSFCQVAREFDCVFAERSGAILRPYSEVLVRTLIQSDAAHFVRDPERYIREAVQADPEP